MKAATGAAGSFVSGGNDGSNADQGASHTDNGGCILRRQQDGIPTDSNLEVGFNKLL